MYWPTAVFFLFFASTCFAAAPTGIPRELARERAQMISALRYHLFFRLVPHASSTVGREELAFKLKSATPLLVDYREGTVSKVEVNSDTVPVQQQNGHILLPAEKLRAGENRVIFEFESQLRLQVRQLLDMKTRMMGASTSTRSLCRWTRAWPFLASISRI